MALGGTATQPPSSTPGCTVRRNFFVFPWWAALAIGVTHLLIDTRVPVAWWSKLIRQTQPDPSRFPVMDIGADVRIWADQVWHIGVIAALSLAATA